MTGSGDGRGHSGHIVKLRDGSRARLRPIAAGDKQILAAAMERMSDESRYRRFFTSIQGLSRERLAYLTEVDHVDHEAIIAVEPGTGAGLGVARFVRRPEDPETAEVAFAVIDEWQGRGLGRALLTKLAARARQEGVTSFYALVQHENAKSVKLLSKLNLPETVSLGADRELLVKLPAERGIGVQLTALLRAAAAGAVEAGQSIMTHAWIAEQRPELRPWKSIATVIVGTDGSETAAVAVQAAVDVAERFGATLHVVTAYRSAPDRPRALGVLAGVQAAVQREGIAVEGHAVLGEPAPVLLEVARVQDAELIVVGSKGMTGPESLLGSVPNSVSHHAPCSVLVARTV
jgi:nucleotide-binding universal stress UspA family protein/GNAT superfamily N-acetyltransferase